jgi:hypothetical protein
MVPDIITPKEKNRNQTQSRDKEFDRPTTRSKWQLVSHPTHCQRCHAVKETRDRPTFCPKQTTIHSPLYMFRYMVGPTYRSSAKVSGNNTTAVGSRGTAPVPLASQSMPNSIAPSLPIPFRGQAPCHVQTVVQAVHPGHPWTQSFHLHCRPFPMLLETKQTNGLVPCSCSQKPLKNLRTPSLPTNVRWVTESSISGLKAPDLTAWSGTYRATWV